MSIRKCCKKDVEDEMHFLFDCKANDAIRSQFYDKCPELAMTAVKIDKLKYLVT